MANEFFATQSKEFTELSKGFFSVFSVRSVVKVSGEPTQ